MEERSMIERLRNQLDWSEDDMNKLLQELTETAVERIIGKKPESDKNEVQYDEYELKVVLLLRKVGVPPHVNGYEYIKAALIYYHETDNRGKPVTKYLYADIAKKYDTTIWRIERAMDRAIDAAYDINLPGLREVGGDIYPSKSSRPSNVLFLSILDEYLKYN